MFFWLLASFEVFKEMTKLDKNLENWSVIATVNISFFFYLQDLCDACLENNSDSSRE